MVAELSIGRRSHLVRGGGGIGSENADMSNLEGMWKSSPPKV